MKRRMTRSRFTKKASYYTANIILVISTLFIMVPIFWMISTSFKTDAEVFEMPPSIIPLKPVIDSYQELFVPENNYFLFFRNSVIVSVVTTAFTVILAIFAGYGLSRFNFKGKPAFLILFLATQMFPFSLLLLTLYLFFSKIGLLNSYFALIFSLTAISLAFSIWMLKNYFDTIPKELEEAAYIDGSSRVGSLFRIILPLVGPGVIAVGIFVFITSWNNYIFPLILSTSPQVRTLPSGITLSYMNFMKVTWNGIMAASFVSALPSVIIFILLQKWFIKGLAAGSVKG